MLSSLLPFAESWLSAAFTDVSRYVIFAVGVWLALWIALAAPLAGRKIREGRPPARQLLIEFATSIRSIMIFSTIGLLNFGLFRAGLMPGPHIARELGPVWFWTSLVPVSYTHLTLPTKRIV